MADDDDARGDGNEPLPPPPLAMLRHYVAAARHSSPISRRLRSSDALVIALLRCLDILSLGDRIDGI